MDRIQGVATLLREEDGSRRLIGSTFAEGLTKGTLTFLEYGEDLQLLFRTTAKLPVSPRRDSIKHLSTFVLHDHVLLCKTGIREDSIIPFVFSVTFYVHVLLKSACPLRLNS